MRDPVRPDFDNLLKVLVRAPGLPKRVPMVEYAFLKRRGLPLFTKGPPEERYDREALFWSTAGYDYLPVEISLRRDPTESHGNDLAAARRILFLDYSGTGDPHSTGRNWAEGGQGFISSLDDFERFPWPDLDELSWEDFERAASVLPEGMKIIGLAGRAFTAAWWLMGWEGFCMALARNRVLVEKLVDRVCRLQLEAVEKTLDMPQAGAIWLGDDLAYSSDLMMNPLFFRKHVFPWYRRMADACRARGVPFMFHSDGKLDKVINDLVDCGISALHPIEPKAMDIAEVKKAYGERLTLIGNIDLGYTLTRGTPDEVDAEVKERIRVIGEGGGYCVGSSNVVTDFVPIENYEAMRAAVLRYGEYPLDLML